MYLPVKKATACIQLLTEGASLRSVTRIAGVTMRTLLDLLLRTGEKCERLLKAYVRAVRVQEVQADEIWCYIGMKERTKNRLERYGEFFGDAYVFVAIERHTKLVLAWHLGWRTQEHTQAFIQKLSYATAGTFQLTTDGFHSYPDAVARFLGGRVHFAQLVKSYAKAHPAQSPEGERRYSPASMTEVIKIPRFGNPDPALITTSHIERNNLNMRMQLRRLTRLTNAFSRKRENLKAALALYFAHHNFVRIHTSLRCTPAMEAGITKHVWSLKDLLDIKKM
jgi:IS1 family transposase